MSFNEIAVFRTALGAISRLHPKLINAGKRNLMWVIVSYPDGCFIGQAELADQAGLDSVTVLKYLRELRSLGFINREQTYARKGVRQCYRVNVRNMEQFVSMSPVTPLSSESNPLMPIAGDSKTVTESANGYHQEHPYREYKDNKYDKENDRLSHQPKSALKVNDQRWHFISQDLDPYVRRKWQHSVESEQLLDTIETLPNWTLQRLQSDLGALDFTTSHDNCGLLMAHLRGLAGSTKAPKVKPVETSTVSNDMERVFSSLFSLPKDI
jgi:DNA-binding transcriptional regulator YhcF (GntR family)